MEGTLDLLEREIQCPACMRWAYPQLPRATGFVRLEEAGQSRLNELAGAAEEVEAWNNRRSSRTYRRPQPVTPPQPPQKGWYVLTDSGPQGPFSDKQIIQFARAGKINAANRLRKASNGTEVRAGDIPNLFGAPPDAKDGWYIHTSKGDVGPLAHAKVAALAKAGKIGAKTMMRYGDDGQFIAAGTVQGLIPTTT